VLGKVMEPHSIEVLRRLSDSVRLQGHLPRHREPAAMRARDPNRTRYHVRLHIRGFCRPAAASYAAPSPIASPTQTGKRLQQTAFPG
jgi:hypothetical protein